MAIQLIINKELELAKMKTRCRAAFIIEELTDLVEEAVLLEFDRITERGGVLGAMETMYQRGKIQEESLYYETLKHTGELPLIGVNTFLSKDGSPTILPREVIRATEEEKEAQIAARLGLNDSSTTSSAQAASSRSSKRSQVSVSRPQSSAIPSQVSVSPPQSSAIPSQVSVSRPQSSAIPSQVSVSPPQSSAIPSQVSVSRPQSSAIPSQVFCITSAELCDTVTGFCITSAELCDTVTGFCATSAELCAGIMNSFVVSNWLSDIAELHIRHPSCIHRTQTHCSSFRYSHPKRHHYHDVHLPLIHI
jgi:hypothetical protein